MSEEKVIKKNKGGRPQKQIKRDQQLAVMCTTIERFVIAHKAKSVNLTISEFLRTLALKGQVDTKIKALPKEVLEFKAQLSHLSANINQIAKKRNNQDELNAIERAQLKLLSEALKQVVNDIKNYLQ